MRSASRNANDSINCGIGFPYDLIRFVYGVVERTGSRFRRVPAPGGENVARDRHRVERFHRLASTIGPGPRPFFTFRPSQTEMGPPPERTSPAHMSSFLSVLVILKIFRKSSSEFGANLYHKPFAEIILHPGARSQGFGIIDIKHVALGIVKTYVRIDYQVIVGVARTGLRVDQLLRWVFQVSCQ
jgi:hypothetical protein